jgi:hypothetical protein
MFCTHSAVIVEILVLLAPGGFSWFREESRPSRSFTVGAAMLRSTLRSGWLSLSDMGCYARLLSLRKAVVKSLRALTATTA